MLLQGHGHIVSELQHIASYSSYSTIVPCRSPLPSTRNTMMRPVTLGAIGCSKYHSDLYFQISKSSPFLDTFPILLYQKITVPCVVLLCISTWKLTIFVLKYFQHPNQ